MVVWILDILFDHEKPICKQLKSQISRTEFVNKKNNIGLVALHFASFRGNLEIIQHLIQKGADVRATDHEGKTMLHAATQSEKVEIIYYFLTQHNFEIDQGDVNGSSALHWASNMHLEVSLTYLIAWGSDINLEDKDGNTPLHLAV